MPGGRRSISLGIEHVASSFRLALTERWPGQPQRQMPRAGAKASVAIGSEVVITGYIDQLDATLEGETHTIGVEGRSLAADLIDCSPALTPSSWVNRKLEDIASAIAAPIGVTIVADVDTGPAFARFAIEPGESCWDAISRMLKQRALVAVSHADGSVHVVSPKPGPVRATIREGVAPMKLHGRHDVGDRFSSYTAIGQASGNDQHNGAAVAGPKGEASDPAVSRHRPLVVMAEDQASPASLQARASWEAMVRAARSQSLNLTLPAWRAPDAGLWALIDAVAAEAPSAWIADTMMVTELRFMVDEQGKRSEIGLRRPEAYTPAPPSADPSALGAVPKRKARFA